MCLGLHDSLDMKQHRAIEGRITISHPINDGWLGEEALSRRGEDGRREERAGVGSSHVEGTGTTMWSVWGYVEGCGYQETQLRVDPSIQPAPSLVSSWLQYEFSNRTQERTRCLLALLIGL